MKFADKIGADVDIANEGGAYNPKIDYTILFSWRLDRDLYRYPRLEQEGLK